MAKRIVTLTLNPAVDSSCSTDRVRPLHKVRTTNERFDPGGGGINVARVINELGGTSFSVFLAGGRPGDVLEELVHRAGVRSHRIAISEPTRVSHVVFEESTGQEFRFTPEGPRVAQDEWREALLRALALIEAEIDFAPDEEVPDALWESLAPSLQCIADDIRARLDDGHRGERLRQGVSIAVIGAPNVGKSSLVNAIAKRDVAIVTDLPGTTRDVIEVALDLDGLPITLLDTAGLRESNDPIEQAGIARARERAAQADLRLHVVDCPSDLGHEDAFSTGTLLVLNKVDLWSDAVLPPSALAVSVHTGEGLARLLSALANAARALLPGEDAVLVTRTRHRVALDDAVTVLDRALALGAAADLGLLAEELRLAAQAIGRVTGAFGIEDVLDRIFATFCIGK